ncbi:hypothetical protein [Nostoc spongiaeforme]|nr:hypothetical protein [Nostoc spongiaeforme]
MSHSRTFQNNYVNSLTWRSLLPKTPKAIAQMSILNKGNVDS